MSARPPAAERLANPDAVLTTSDLVELGYGRRGAEAIFRAAARSSGVEQWPGYSRPLLRVRDFLRLREEATFRDDRVRPS
jgi:hypothetical protein